MVYPIPHKSAMPNMRRTSIVRAICGGPVTTESVNEGAWHHLIITYSLADGSVSMYVDANPPLTTSLGSAPLINGGGILILREDGAGFDPAFDGYLDDFKLYVDHLDPSDPTKTVSGIVTPDLIPVSTARPILNWTFDLDENDPLKPGGDTITDASGNNNAGFVTIGSGAAGMNGALPKFPNGAKLSPGHNGGMAMDLTMPDPQGQVDQYDPGGAAFNGVFRSPVNGLATDEITVAFWVKTTYTNGAIFAYAADPSTVVTTNPGDFAIVLENGDIKVYRGNSVWDTGVTLGFDVWRHVVVTWRGSNGFSELYINGIRGSVHSSFAPGALPTGANNALAIGQGRNNLDPNYNTSAYSFTGLLDDVRVYDHVISDREIGLLKNTTPAFDWSHVKQFSMTLIAS